VTGRRADGPWREAARTQAVCAALAADGYRVLFVGGCVRNALLGRSVVDVDLATDARPETVSALAEAAGLHAVPTGIEHGTVTVVSGGQPYEVTTFRRDVETFGRRASVAFSQDLVEDAARRDFTMNALYAEPDGRLVDPLGGLSDLLARRVRFVGDPVQRITEDYLRILRFFRIHAWYGDPCGGLDPEGLAACATLQDGLDTLSRERVGAEVTKLLAAPDPAPAVAAMAAAGILGRILPGADPNLLAPLADLEADAAARPRWQRRLAALGRGEDWETRLRLSRADAKDLGEIAAALATGETDAAAAWRHGPDLARDAALIRAAALGTRPAPDLEAALARGAAATFPVRAADLSLSGPALGGALRRLQERWLASDLRLDAAALLEDRDG
jgi:poly(A) polymerase